MTKSIDEMSADELRKALAEKEEQEKQDDLDSKFDKIKEAFAKAQRAASDELIEARRLRQEARALNEKAEAMVIAAAEKHNVPIRWGNEGYIPKNVKTWVAEAENDPDLIDWVNEMLNEEGYGRAYGETGWWQPSYC